MNKKLWIKRKIFICISILIVMIICTVSHCFKNVSAASRPEMKDGKIYIYITSKTATSNIRYRTLGFYVTTKYQDKKVSAKGNNGETIWGPDAPPSPSKRLPLNAGIKESSSDPTTGETTVKYTYDEKYVKDLMRDIIDLDKLDKFTDQTPIYFNAIFQTYQIVNGKEIILTPEITTWKGIVNDQNWANKDDFISYFNIEVKFDAGLQPNDLYFDLDGTIKKQGSLGEYLINDTLRWKNKVTDTYTDDNNVQYKLTGYYVKSKLTGKEITRKMVGGSIKVSDIINGSATVLYGGLDVYMIFEPYNLTISIDAKDIDTDEDIKQGLYTGTVEPGESFSQTIDNIITANGISYAKTEHFYYLYTNKAENFKKVKIVSDSDDSPIEFQIPSDVKIPGKITVKAYYKASDIKSDEIILRTIMVSRSGALIEDISTEKVTKGQSISKTIQKSRYVNNITYQYIDKWDYTYATSSGETTKTGSGNTASFKISQDTKLGTIITLRLYYDASQEVEVPEPAPPISLPIDTPSPYAVINGDKYGANYFLSKEGISTTESQYVYVKTQDYLLGYRLVNRTGKVAFTVPVTMTYTFQYFTATPEEFGGPEPVTDTVTDTQHITVERAYSYWEIESLEYYIPSSANVYNYSLPNGGVSLRANGSYLNVPDLTTWHSSSLEDHYELPSEAEGIQLVCDTTFSSENADRPSVEYQDLTAYALEMTGQLKVKNDYLVFNGSTVLSDSLTEKITSYPSVSALVQTNNIIHDKVLYTEGQVIDAIKKNGVYQSNGNVTYARHSMSVNAYQSSKVFNMPVNNVTIHTPVICDPKIYSDNDKYVQLISPTEGAYHMVLDPDTSLNDFTVRISNKLPHSARLGYYERDFSRSFIDPENVSYIAKKEGIVRNEMKLPFDVYIDTLNDNKPENDEFIRAGTWIILGRETHRFYVPMWVQEGVYTAQFRSIAVNGTDKLDNTETTRNANINNYVATDTRTFQISGRMYGLTLYDISDDGRWKDVFRIKDTMMFKYFEGAEDGTKRSNYHDDYAYYYTVGINNQYGYQNGRNPKYTLPLLNGSHPKYKNVGVIKTGYAFRFMIDTVGEMYSSGCKIRIIPTFYHVDENGKNRQQVDIYYDEEFYNKQHYLVKIGEGIDLANVQEGFVGNIYSRIPEAELRHTARVMDTTYVNLKNQYGPMYSYSEIRLTSQFRTFIGLDYASHITDLPSFKKVNEQIRETELNLSKYMQRWYGTYKLPTNIHVVPQGYDVNDYLKKHGIDYHEDFWLKDGYIIVNFNIETIDKNGNRHLSYTNGYNYLNNGHCSMWVMEGGTVEKKDNTGAVFSLKAGDVVFYYTDKKHSDDYIGRLY